MSARARSPGSPPRRSPSAWAHSSQRRSAPSADARTAIGSAVIDLTPGPAKEWAIQTFGTNDKLFLSVMVLVVIASSRRSPGSGSARGYLWAARRSRLPPSPVRPRCCPARTRRWSTSSPRWSGRRAASPRCVPHFEAPRRRGMHRPSERRNSCSRTNRSRTPIVAGGLRVSRRRRRQRRGRRGAVAADCIRCPATARPSRRPPWRSPSPRPRRRAARRRRAAQLRHLQQGLLPDRHRVERSAAQPHRLGAEDPRHGRPRNHLPLRRSGEVRTRSRRW